MKVAGIVWLCAAFVAPVASQITVGPAGSGAAFTEISTALATASPGARIYVDSGVYQPFSVSQSVSIIGTGSCQVVVVPGMPAIEVTQLPAGDAVRISNIQVDAPGGSSAPRVRVHQCAGIVEFGSVPSRVSGGATGACYEITYSDLVFMDTCVINSESVAAAAVVVQHSYIWCNNCVINGADGVSYGSSPGIYAYSSQVHLALCRITGGDGGYTSNVSGSDGAHGVLAVAYSQIVIAGGPGNSITGGDGNWWHAFGGSNGGSAVAVNATSIVRYASDVVMAAGFTFGNPVSAVSGPSIAESSRRLTMKISSLFPSGGWRTLACYGPGGDVIAVFASPGRLDPIWLGAGHFLYIDPHASVFVGFVQLLSNGVGGVQIFLPPAPALRGLSITLQGGSAVASPLRLSAPAMTTIF